MCLSGILALKMEPMGRFYKKCKENLKWWSLRKRTLTNLGLRMNPGIRKMGPGLAKRPEASLLGS